MKIRVNPYAVGVVLLIFCIFQYSIQKICGFSLYPDEFGYWASAARMAGYDWSEVASLGSYYSFGYSLILFPLLKLFGGGTVAYRAAIAVNMILMCGSVFLIRRIIEKIFPDIGPETGILIGGMAALYPTWIFYMQTTMTEALLFFMFILDVYLFADFMERQRAGTAAALALSLAYGYCVHMRTVGTVAACVLALLLWTAFGRGKKRGVMLGCGALLGMGLLALCLKERTVAEIYAQAGEELLAVNDYGGQISKLSRICTVPGMLRLLGAMAGKLYYLGLASFGTFYWALGWCARECILLAGNVRRKQAVKPAQWTALFLLLSAAGQIAVSSVFLYRGSMIDNLIYGRYNELLVPVMMAIGVVAMSRSPHPVRRTALTAVALGVGTLVLLWVIDKTGMSGLRGYHIAGISYLLPDENVNVTAFFGGTWLLGCAAMFLVCALVCLGRRRESAWWLLTGVLALEIIAGLQISGRYSYSSNAFYFQNRMLVERLQESAADGLEIRYLDEGELPAVGYLQMQLAEQKIRVVKPEEAAADSSHGVLVTYGETTQDELLSERYEKKMTAAPFCLYYH